MSAAVRELGNGIYQLPTDYPEVCNAPLWTYLVADGDRLAHRPRHHQHAGRHAD